MEFLATDDEIRSGRTTDIYFERAIEILRARGVRKRVYAEVIAKNLPRGWPWGVLCGVEDCARLLAALPVECRALPEGSAFFPWEPVLAVEGYYEDFGAFETAILGFLCQASGVATAAARCKKAAGHRSVISFGARRMHPAVTPMIERAAWIAGCDGVSTVLAADKLDIAPAGTMPHSLCLLLGSTREAVIAFDEVIDPRVARVALIDTFGDEKFEAVAAAEAIGARLSAVRLDTPASRRGDFKRIIEEVRWELDLRGFQHVRILVSGGIGEEEILHLNDVVDGYGVGTRIAGAPTVDFSLDIVEIDGVPAAKRGKESGRKETARCAQCGIRAVHLSSLSDPACECGGALEPLLAPLTSAGRRVDPPETLEDIRARAAAEIADLDLAAD